MKKVIFSQLLLGALLCFSVSLAAETITGTVLNKTTGKPAAGDDVVLLKLAQGMQEAARTQTDAHGHFKLTFDDDNAQHLVRVNHQKATYFQPAPQGTHEIKVEVYDAAEKVSGLNGEAYVLRLQTDQGQLQVALMIGVKNESAPPRTQIGEHGFDVYIPEDAVIDGTVASGPGGMPVTVTAVPLEPKGHYGVAFPIRPGETRIQLSYHLPYSGSLSLSPRLTIPTENAAVMIPKSMQIQSNAFQQNFEEGGARIYVIKSAQPDQTLEFKVSGTGTLPDLNSKTASDQSDQNADASQPNNAPNAANGRVENRPGGGLGAPEGGEDPLQKYRWPMLGIFGLMLAAGAFILAKASNTQKEMPQPVAGAAEGKKVQAVSSPISALKEELFQLEADKLQGRISEEEYAQTKAALDVVLRRALAKDAKKPS